MDIKDIKEIYESIKETDIIELEIEDERGKFKIKRKGAGEPEVLRAAVAPRIGEKEEIKEETKSNVRIITSPMVGTFYRSPSPEAPPFAEIGTRIKAGEIVCIIEAMKLMNEVESDSTGKIVAVLVENGQPVEYGEPLFHIEI